MSETAISRLTISSPLALRTLRLRLFLLTLVSLKFPEVFRLVSRCCGVVELGSRPRSFSGHSILMISAPKAPSQRVAQGPARTQLKSTTRMFSRARARPISRLSQWGRKEARHGECVEQHQLVVEFEGAGLANDAVLIEPGREEAGLALLVGLEDGERGLDQSLPRLLADNPRQPDQVTVAVD